MTYFTFLPSFLFILAGSPLVETTHGNLKFNALLTGIFAYYVLWSHGFKARFNAVTALIGLSALLWLCYPRHHYLR